MKCDTCGKVIREGDELKAPHPLLPRLGCYCGTKCLQERKVVVGGCSCREDHGAKGFEFVTSYTRNGYIGYTRHCFTTSFCPWCGAKCN